MNIPIARFCFLGMIVQIKRTGVMADNRAEPEKVRCNPGLSYNARR